MFLTISIYFFYFFIYFLFHLGYSYNRIQKYERYIIYYYWTPSRILINVFYPFFRKHYQYVFLFTYIHNTCPIYFIHTAIDEIRDSFSLTFLESIFFYNNIGIIFLVVALYVLSFFVLNIVWNLNFGWCNYYWLIYWFIDDAIYVAS